MSDFQRLNLSKSSYLAKRAIRERLSTDNLVPTSTHWREQLGLSMLAGVQGHRPTARVGIIVVSRRVSLELRKETHAKGLMHRAMSGRAGERVHCCHGLSAVTVQSKTLLSGVSKRACLLPVAVAQVA